MKITLLILLSLFAFGVGRYIYWPRPFPPGFRSRPWTFIEKIEVAAIIAGFILFFMLMLSQVIEGSYPRGSGLETLSEQAGFLDWQTGPGVEDTPGPLLANKTKQFSSSRSSPASNSN